MERIKKDNLDLIGDLINVEQKQRNRDTSEVKG